MDFPAAVIFDTNAYRAFTRNKTLEEVRQVAGEIRAKDEKADVLPLAHPIVAWELLNHLADPKDKSYQNCLNSVAALAVHTGLENGHPALLADSETTISKPLFGEVHPGYLQGILNIGNTVAHIAKSAPDLSNPTCQANLASLHAGMAQREKTWLQSMKRVTDEFCPGAFDAAFGPGNDTTARAVAHAFFSGPLFFEAWSRGIVVMAALTVGFPFDQKLIGEKSEIVRDKYATPFRLLQALMLKLVSPSPPALDHPEKKRWNFVWDSMISFSVGDGTVNGRPVYLVTDDGAIVEAAKAAGVGDQVLALADYRREVNSRAEK